MTTQTPPPTPPAPTPTPSRSRAASRAVALLTVALGGAVVVATAVGGIVPAVALAAASDPARSSNDVVAVDRVREVDIDVSAVTFTVLFDDVDEASLDIRGARSGDWTFHERDGSLIVESPRNWFGSWFATSRDARATLTLPRALEGVDVEADLGAGSFEADGTFGEFDLNLGAGRADVMGSATSLSVEMGAGRADIDLDGVRDADLEVSAGAMVARLTGDAPDELDLTVSAGSLDVTVPDAEYDITSEVSAGDFTHDLRTSSDSPHTLSAEVSAGDLTVRAG